MRNLVRDIYFVSDDLLHPTYNFNKTKAHFYLYQTWLYCQVSEINAFIILLNTKKTTAVLTVI